MKDYIKKRIEDCFEKIDDLHVQYSSLDCDDEKGKEIVKTQMATLAGRLSELSSMSVHFKCCQAETVKAVISLALICSVFDIEDCLSLED